MTYADMPLDTCLVITIWGCDGVRNKIPLAGTCFRFFGKYSVLKKGKYRCKLWPGVMGHVSQTPGKIIENSEVNRLEKVFYNHDAKVDQKI
jgi:hypothetical protein